MNLRSRGRSRIMLTVDSARCGVVSGRIERSGIAPNGVKLGFEPSIGGVYPPDLPARIRVPCVPARNRWSSLRVCGAVIQRALEYCAKKARSQVFWRFVDVL